jgi:PAS domain S-box-containing protein
MQEAQPKGHVLAALLSHPFRVFSVLIVTIFSAELVVMKSLGVFLPELSPAAATLLDATLLSVLIAPVLWFVVVRPLRGAAVEERLRADTVVTLRKKDEHDLRLARFSLDHSADMILWVNRDGQFIYANDTVLRLVGYSREELLGMSLWQLALGQAPEAWPAVWEGCRQAGSAALEDAIRRKDGSTLPVEVVVTHVDFDGMELQCAVIRDITERQRARQAQKRVEEELRRAKDAADEASHLKSDFLASMSHEIRTPMNGVLGMTGVLLDTDLTTDQREYAETIRRSGESLLAIINDVLDFSKIESGKLALETAPFDLCAVVEDVADLLATSAREKRLDLIVRYGVETPRHVIGDAGRVQQVVTNLAGNAIKFTSSGHVLIDVNDAPGSEAGSGLFQIRVEDSGIGISEDQVAHLFDRFTQADASTTRRFGGTGLGLAISKQLVVQMGGSISAAPREGGGSAFFFSLTLPLQAEPPAARSFPADLRDVRALIVDDHEVNRRVVAGQLASWGMRSDAAESGEEALAKLLAADKTGDPFGIVLLDFLMPGMDGAAVAQAIRSEPALRDSIVIMLSSVERRVVQRDKPVDAAFDDWLVKPVRQSRLMDALAAAWNGRRRDGDGEPVASRLSAVTRGPLVKARVLVVDDSAVNQRVAALQLARLGCRVDAAANGLEAVQMTARYPYDVVFMDCQMPEMDGYEATAEIRRREATHGRVPIVAMTAHAMPGERERCLAAGMDDYLSKPIRPTELEAALRKWAGHGAEPAGTVAGRTPSESEPRASDAAAAQVLARVRGLADDEVMVKEVVELFLDGATESLRDLRASEGTADASAFARSAHKLKGSARNVGAEALAGIAERLEERVGARGLQNLAQLLAAADAELARLREALEESMGR